MKTTDNLIYRRQFILISKKIADFTDWRSETIILNNTKLYLYCHDDLEFQKGQNNFFQLYILGYLIDPYNPTYNNEDILSCLLKYKKFDAVINSINKYNGRFAIMYIEKNNIKIINDLTGFREVYYCFTDKSFACGSTPTLISKVLNISKTKNPDITGFFNSDAFKKTNNVWVGYKTLYDDILHLPPNHYLDWKKKQVTRFWPSIPLKTMDIKQCAYECAKIIKGTISGASKRYKIHMGLTAGWDTRLLLSATRENKDSIYYYINKPDVTPKILQDIKISQQLSEKLGFNLNILDIPHYVDKKFRDIYFRNNDLARESLLPVFFNAYQNKWDDTYTLSGTMGNGLARIYMPFPNNVEINGKNIAVFPKYHYQPYAVDALDNWAKEVKIICSDYNIDIMDLYQLEQENAHWASLSASEQDIVREEIRPFNTRYLVELFWSLEKKYRYQYYPIIYIKIMRILWKDVLNFPFNPSWKSSLYKLLRMLNIEQKVYYFYKKKKYIKLLNS